MQNSYTDTFQIVKTKFLMDQIFVSLEIQKLE